MPAALSNFDPDHFDDNDPHLKALDPTIQKKVLEWLHGPYDKESKHQIRDLLQTNPKELIDAFYTDLTFGTAGLRGIMGLGTNRMNQYIVRKATQGLANYLLKQRKNTQPSVFIGFDSRHHSQEYAEDAACVFAANNIKVYLLKELRPTPFVSFGTREKKCLAGVMITASHNPAKYNGYKVYWSDGAQVVPPHDVGIMEEVKKILTLDQVKMTTLPHPLVEIIESPFDQAYIDAIRPLQCYPEQNKQYGNTLKICYTSLHGTGITLAPAALKDWGFSQILFVDKQIVPDGNFPTVAFPNPEFKEALQLGIERLTETQSDILLATDPDADRMGVVVMHKGQPIILSGNQVGAICVEYICSTLSNRNALPEKGAFVTTIVSTELLNQIASAYNRPCFNVLTGFKYIGEKIHEWENDLKGYQFLFGAEESYGYLLGTVARDKDAIVTSCLLAEIALHAKRERKTLVDRLHDIYHRYGLYKEKQYSFTFEGKTGAEHILNLMNSLRENPPKTFGGKKVQMIEDYKKHTRVFLGSGKKEELTLPSSDVLLFRLEDDSKLIIRPSGTEPKIKIYASCHEKNVTSIEQGLNVLEKRLDQLLELVKKDMKL